jgi:hypothetical protein
MRRQPLGPADDLAIFNPIQKLFLKSGFSSAHRAAHPRPHDHRTQRKRLKFQTITGSGNFRNFRRGLETAENPSAISLREEPSTRDLGHAGAHTIERNGRWRSLHIHVSQAPSGFSPTSGLMR